MALGNVGKISQRRLLSRIATNDRHGENSAYFDGLKAYNKDPFHPTQNPEGVIQMGLAENQLSVDLIEEWIKKNPKASICTPEGMSKFREIANFQDYHGLPEFRNGVAKLMSKVRGGRVQFDADRILMSGGATGANELIMFCLADPGDAFLIPSPYYPAFDRDLSWRTKVNLVPVHCDSSNNFKITREALEEAYDKANEDNINIKGLIIENPSNPLGTTLDKEALKSLVSFINEKSIHLVCDEIFAAAVFNSPRFVSVAEVIQEMECNLTLIHIIYSLSKDMGFPGFRVGIVYSYNDVVVSCGQKMSSFGLVSSQTQHMLAAMLLDDEFVDKFLKESSKRLAKRHEIFTKGLEKVGITCLPSNTRLFCWMNMRSLLKVQTFEEEMALWHVIINEVKLNLSPGSSFHCVEPGWFRVCIANMNDPTAEVALKRIRAFVGKEIEKPTKVIEELVKVNKYWQSNLQLSFTTKRFKDTIMSPNLISPHSSMSHSHLIQTK